MQYINISERYGNAELATIDEYRQLNPGATFEARPDGIYEQRFEMAEDGDGKPFVTNVRWERVGSVIGDTVTVDADGEDFYTLSRAWRFYRGALRADGGDADDFIIRSIEVPDDADTIEIEITADDVARYDFAVANGLSNT